MDNAEMLKTFLAERDLPCPSCTYNLRGLRNNVCPECHQSLEVTVALTEPKLALFLTAVVGLAMGVGFSALLFFYAIVISMRKGLTDIPREFWVITGVGLVVTAPLLLLMLRKHKAIRRWRIAARVWLAIAAWLLTLANVLVFSIFVS